VQAYRARYERGRVVPLGNPSIPEGSDIILTILEDSADNVCHRQKAALARFREEIQGCDEPVPDFERVIFKDAEV